MADNAYATQQSGSVFPEPNKSHHKLKPRAGIGGTHTHGPVCVCRPCKARRRGTETFTVTTGAGRAELETIDPTPEALDKPKRKVTAPRNLKDRIAQFVHYNMLMPDATKSEIAGKMGLSPSGLANILRNGQASGILKFVDPLERIEYEIVPKIVDNLNFFLDAKDKTVTIEAAKGTIFRAYQESKGISDAQQTVLALKIELPDASGGDLKVLTGHIVGSPKRLIDSTIYEDADETHP